MKPNERKKLKLAEENKALNEFFNEKNFLNTIDKFNDNFESLFEEFLENINKL